MAIVLYLAEIQKQNKGFMGGVETRLKLLACQRNDQSWSIVSGNESIAADEASDFGEGALVVVNLGVNRQLQGKPESAVQRIVGILQGFSRLLEKTKNQEQEIEQWKESLTIQSEELSRREIEMETRLEQLEQMEEEFKEFEQQRQEISLARAEAEKAKAEFEAKNLELQAAWEQLQGQQQHLQEQIKQSRVLDENQANRIQERLQALSSAANSTSSIKGKLQLAVKAVNAQQETIQPYWQELEQRSQNIQNKQQQLNQCETELARNRQELEALATSLSETELKLHTEQKSVAVKQELTKLLESQEQAQVSMLQMLSSLDTESSERGGTKLDLQALENMPLPKLETIVEELQKDLEKVAKFVNDQEEELGWQCQAVEELEAKIAQANEFERLTLEQELADEKEAKKMLDQTLVGQRRSLKERHEILLQHSRILKRRKGIVDLDTNFQDEIDLEPIKQNLKQQQADLSSKKQQLSAEIAQIEQKISELEVILQQQTIRKQELESEINRQQNNWQELKIAIVQMQSKIDFYQQHLQPLQNTVNSIRQEVSEIEQLMAAYAENNPEQTIDEIDRIITELTAI